MQQFYLEALRRRWKWFLALGVLMTVLGAVMAVYSVATPMTTMLVIGSLMMAGWWKPPVLSRLSTNAKELYSRS